MMAQKPNERVFRELWPKCFIIFMALIELVAVVILILTELGNVAANFWITNVFAGGWCGLIMLIHLILLFMTGCSPKSAPAFRAVIVSCIGLIACATLISFDAVFVAQPTTCILTPSCASNAASNTTFSYNFQQSFFTVFNSWAPFKSFTVNQAKFLFQTIQLGIGGLCFITCIIYIIIYYVCIKKAKEKVVPTMPTQLNNYYAPPPPPSQPIQQAYYPSPPSPLQSAEQGYYPSSAASSPLQPAQQGYYASSPSSAAVQQGFYPTLPPVQGQHHQQSASAWHPAPYVPQAQPGAIPWNANRRY